MEYSVLMSVYYKEKPDNLRQSMESIFAQTMPTNDFVLVCDGPLGDGLIAVIDEMMEKHPDVLQVIRLEKNMGLGNALNTGMKHCRNELVARMDSDDISYPNRCERQISEFEKDACLDIMSATILEFIENTNEITGKRLLPLTHQEICQFSKKRNPFNHPVVMFRKHAVEAAGGYKETYHLFEDYYLWIRMLQSGCKGKNLAEPLLCMRTPKNLYMRRGGVKYAKDLLRFNCWLINVKWSRIMDFMMGAIPHAFLCVLPNGVRRFVYEKLHKL